MRKYVTRINKLLIGKFGIPTKSKSLPDPLDMLIATILSQNTNDKNSYIAYQNLKNSYHDWFTAADSPVQEIEELIRIAGLAPQKSKTIKDFLQSAKKDGKISLEYFNKLNNDEILSELTRHAGIGIKTASCVLLFSLDRNVCPVDTHVHRTLNRIGIVNTSTPDKTFLIINKKLPEGIAHQFHTNLIRLGRGICKSQNPDCSICPLLKICKYSDKNISLPRKYKSNDFMLLDNV